MAELKNNILIGIILCAVFWLIVLGVWEFANDSSVNNMTSVPLGGGQERVKQDVANNTKQATAQPIETDGTYTLTNKKEKGIDIDVQSKTPFKMTLPTSLRNPVTITLGDNKTIEVIQKDGAEYGTATKGNTVETAENAKLLSIIEKDPTLSTYVSNDNKKTIFYSYQKTAGEQKQWLFKNWTLYNVQTNKTETVSYEMRNAVVNIDTLGNANVYFDDKTTIRNRTPDFTIPRPYILDKDATKTDLMWTYDAISHTLSVSFTALASSYPIALDPSILKTDTVIATFSGKRISMHFTCGTSTVTGVDGNTYGTVTGADGKCWMDRNLGATQVATSSTDYLAYGSLFQWGRRPDGHQLITWTSSTTGTGVNGSTATNADIPGDSLFITEGFPPYDWRVTPSDTLWANSSSTNNPCPASWHVPTLTEWVTWVTAAGVTNASTAYSSTLKLSLAGLRLSNTAGLVSQSSLGYYWSSSPDGTTANGLTVHSGGAAAGGGNNRAHGFSVRCLKD